LRLQAKSDRREALARFPQPAQPAV
jgi:hypothetical protein